MSLLVSILLALWVGRMSQHQKAGMGRVGVLVLGMK